MPSGFNASSTADAITCGTAMVPASPTPLIPSGLSGDGVCMWIISTAGTSVAKGIRKSMKLALRGVPSSSNSMRSSMAPPIPCAIPPMTWPSTIIGLIMLPQSWTQT